LLPLAWTVLWGVFRGAYAHGGFVWWQTVHHLGLALLGLFAFALNWRLTGPLRPHQLLALGASSAGALLLLTWLSFQTGLALHLSPTSVSSFLFDEP
jgi:hypothetical protein